MVAVEATRYAKDSISEDHPYHGLRRFLRPGVTVLDVGCGSGDVAQFLADTGAMFDGIEMNEDRAAVASPHYRQVLVGGFEEVAITGQYDVILFLDVLEHLVDPSAAMRWAADHLAEGGAVLSLIPNAAHWTARMKIVRGDWSYAETGLFDRDHLRFFDVSTAGQVASGSDLIERSRHVYPGPFPRWWRFQRDRSLDRWPNLFAYHVLLEWRRQNG